MLSEGIHQKSLTFTPSVPNLLFWGEAMARTNIELDDRLINEGLKVFKCKSKRELVHLALKELLKSAKRKEILKLRGQVQWDGDLDELRRRRL
jgi:Arc/MetJ family transcription regulator